MDELNKPTCSHNTESIAHNQQEDCKSKHVTTVSETTIGPETPEPFPLASSDCTIMKPNRSSVSPITCLSFETTMPCLKPSFIQSLKSGRLPNQPPSLFLQALSQLNENSLNTASLLQLNNITKSPETQMGSEDITPPDSLMSAPPSYSYVLRQITARRRPRLMGTFIPSPSFVQHAPPPTYATAFDIYVDNPMPPAPPRACNFGFTSMPAVCPECGFNGMTIVTSKITLCTHMCAFLLCVFCCWICAPLPYILKSCKDVYHHCRNCSTLIGMYCPTNPEHNFSTN